MAVRRIFALCMLGCGAAWAQPVPLRPTGPEAVSADVQEAGKRRSELKAVLQAEEHGASASGRAMDASQRQQLRKQLREHSQR